jgi:MFS family permease
MSPKDDPAAAGSSPGAAGSSLAPARAAAASGTFAPFAIPIFRAVWIAALLSNMGTWMQSVGAAWLMTGLAPQPDMVALVQTAANLPQLLLCLVAGAVADMVDRRLVLLGSQVAMLVAGGALAALTWGDWIGPWGLLALTFLIGCGQAFQSPAWQAAMGEMVGREQLPAAIALNSINFNVTRSVGPALGGLVVAAAGPRLAFALNAASYVGLIGAFLAWRRPADDRRLPRERLVSAMIAGLRYVREAPAIQTVLVRALAFGFSAAAIWALLPIFALERLGGGPTVYGLLLCAMGVGAVVAGFTMTAGRRVLGGEGMVSASYALIAAANLTLASTGWWPAVAAALFATGWAWVSCLSTFNITVQIWAPNWVKARALSIYMTCAFGGMAVGAWVWGEFATLRDTGAALWAAGVLTLIALLALRHRYRMPAGQPVDLTPVRAWPEPTALLDFDRAQVPVLIRVEYLVPPARGDEFALATRALRRVRRRDGAVRWRLWHDIDRPDRWIETYQHASWIEHLRHQARMTEGDAALLARIVAFHAGPAPPRIEHLALHDLSATRLADPSAGA